MMCEAKLLDGEVLKAVPQYQGFISATNKGRIYSHPRAVKKFSAVSNKYVVQHYKGRFLSQYQRNGYATVRFGVDNKKFIQLVSRLVLMAFDREPAAKEFACHNDSNTSNNCIENLRWDDQRGNMRDRTARKLYAQGERHHAAKVPVELVDRLQRKDISPAEAARLTGFRYAHLWRIAKGHCWKHRMPTPEQN